jgi:hypothetical protein
MSILTVPRRVERVLASLGASPEFCQDVLGDLEEEYAIRAAWDGPVAARRWYYRESLRVAPHLLRDWWEQVQWRDGVRLAGVVASSAIAIVALQRGMLVTVNLLAGLFGVTPRQILTVGFTLSDLQAILAANGAISLVIGYLVASLSPKARVPGALLTAAFWTAFMSYAWIRFPEFAPMWFSAANLATCALGMMLGGLARSARVPAASVLSGR